MRDPAAAARCVEAMLAATGGAVPVSVKCRLGVAELPEDALPSGHCCSYLQQSCNLSAALLLVHPSCMQPSQWMHLFS